MRKFRLINGQGGSFDLNRKDSFLHDIKGFGYEDATQYEQIGRDFYPLEEIFSQGKMEGKILFGGKKPYESYREFARFVRSTPLTLVFLSELHLWGKRNCLVAGRHWFVKSCLLHRVFTIRA